MTTQQPRYDRQEFLKRGSEIYESIRSQVEEGNRGKVVAIEPTPSESLLYQLIEKIDAGISSTDRRNHLPTLCLGIGVGTVRTPVEGTTVIVARSQRQRETDLIVPSRKVELLRHQVEDLVLQLVLLGSTHAAFEGS